MLSRKRAAVVTLLGILVLALLFLNSQRYWVRFDLTSAKAYTLSATSKDLYKKIDERVTVTYYLSDALAKMHPSPGMIVDLLREYEAYSRGRVRVVVEDPSRNRSAAIAERLGIAPQLIRPNDRDQERVQTVYSGIVVEYLNRTETIPSVASIETLEYDLTSRIISLLENSPRTIAIVDAVKDADPGTDLAQLANALEGSGYRMSEISLSQGIPSNFPALFVIGGADELKDAELARVEEYLRGGGGVLFAVDGVSVASKGDLRALPVGASPLLDFLQTKGVSVSRELALDVAALTIPYQTRGPSSASSVHMLRYPHWIAVLADNVSKTHPVTARFPGLDLYWPSPLELIPVTGIHEEILATTTARGWRMKTSFATDPLAETAFHADELRTKGKIPVAAALSGVFPTYYARAAYTPRIEAKPSRIIVVADSDFVGPLVQLTRSERNFDFAINAADWLSGYEDLIPIRNREPRSARLDLISDPVERERAIDGALRTNVVLVPAAVVLFGLWRLVRRRQGYKSIR